MSKKELRAKLEELYFQALDQKILDDIGTWTMNNNNYTYENAFIDRILEIEEQLYGVGLNEGPQTISKMPWKKAYKRFLQIKNSPLFAAMEEKE